MKFEKLHGTGNDFIIFNSLEEKLPNYSELAKVACNRNYGIGADGMIVVESSDIASIKMVFYNSDGSEAPMCGNGIRCFSKFIFDNQIIKDKSFNVETLGGIMKSEVIIEDNEVRNVKINMGIAKFDTNSFPINTDKKKFIDEEIELDDMKYKVSSLMLGTIHTIIFVDKLQQYSIKKVGKIVENMDIFPKKTNVNFCEVIDESNLKVITWERGSGQTLSCGTGASATAVVSSLLNNTNKKVNVHVPGGKLKIEIIDNLVYMTGPVRLICKGYFNYNK
ncbi:diaminopimelate epimerase [Clostridium sp. D2Q-14]|nr:diaminopimelate epimerase [Anaeromonas gelatinilytica]